MLYLHETIDIAGTGQDAYIEAVVRRAVHSERVGLSRLIGCWRVIGSTGPWPQVINLWEMEGWAHWAAGLERQFIPERRDEHLGPWWTEVSQWRRGGFDRILVPAHGSPTHAELATSAPAWVFEQTVARPRPGLGAGLAADVAEVLVPLLRRQGILWIGAYTAPMRDDEAVWIFAAPTFAALCAWYERRPEDSGWLRWQQALRDRVNESSTVWLVPGEGTLLRPR